MTKDTTSKSPDAIKVLWHLYMKLLHLVSGKSGGPRVTALARVTVLGAGLACAGPILVQAIGDAWPVLLVLVGLVVAIRVVVRRWLRL